MEVLIKYLWMFVHQHRILSTFAFMCHPCFPTKKVSKVRFFFFHFKNCLGFISLLFFNWKKENLTFETFWWENMDDTQKQKWLVFYAWRKIRFIWPVHVISKRITGNTSYVPHTKSHEVNIKTYDKNRTG